MLVSHEAPFSIMEEVRNKYNDYEYALVHLYDVMPEYKRFFMDSIENGRTVILDNSLFELNQAFDPEKFAEYIIETKPTYYIVPDAWNDGATTRDNFDSFMKNYGKDLPGKAIGVCQGKDIEDFVESYLFMSEKADMISISFGLKLYEDVFDRHLVYKQWCEHLGFDSDGVDAKRMFGRFSLIYHLCADSIWNFNKPHHLLGCSLPMEFAWYQYHKSVVSCDTSSPIVHAIKGILYEPGIGVRQKESQKLVEFMNMRREDIDMALLDANCKMFKTIVNGE